MNGKVKRRTAGSVIASVLLSILLLVPLTLGVLLLEVRGVLSQDGVRYYLDEIELEKLDLAELGTGRKGNLLDDITNSINENLEDRKFTADEVKDLIERSTVKEFLAREIGEIFEDLKWGRTKAAVTADELMKLVEKNWKLIEPFVLEAIGDEMTQAADMAVRGYMDPDLLADLKEFRKTHETDPKYDKMLKTIETTGRIDAGDKDLFLEFIKDELVAKSLKEEISEKIQEEMDEELSTASIRKDMDPDALKAVDTAFSIVPVIALAGICALFVLLYFVADRHIPGDAFIGIGAQLVTVIGPFALAGWMYGSMNKAWQGMCGGNYLASYLVGAFEGYHLKVNLIGKKLEKMSTLGGAR